MSVTKILHYHLRTAPRHSKLSVTDEEPFVGSESEPELVTKPVGGYVHPSLSSSSTNQPESLNTPPSTQIPLTVSDTKADEEDIPSADVQKRLNPRPHTAYFITRTHRGGGGRLMNPPRV